MSATIKVRARFIGFHAWPDAPERRDYLRDRHRHEFHVEVAARVAHDDRDIEFHDFKDDVLACLPEHGANLGASSCELIARTILARLERDYGSSLLWCEVWEDGEVGARVDYVPPIPEVEGDGAVFEAVER